MSKYLEYIISKELRLIYIKNGRWLVHLILFAIFYADFFYTLSEQNLSNPDNPYYAFIVVIAGLPFILFYLFFIIYLIPDYFKKERYALFWQLLLSGLVFFPLLGAWLTYFLNTYFQIIPSDEKLGFVDYLSYIYKGYLSTLLGGTGILYFIELSEEIKLSKRSIKDLDITLTAKMNLETTHTDLPFMIQSIRYIQNALSENHTLAAQKLLDFSQLLRFKIYDNNAPYIALDEEIQNVALLFSVSETQTKIEIDGLLSGKYILKSSIINCLLPFFTFFNKADNVQQILFLIEQDDVSIAMDIVQVYRLDLNIACDKVRRIIKNTFGNKASFELFTNEKNNIQICLPLQKK